MRYVLTIGVVAVMATGVALSYAGAQTRDTWVYDQRGNHVGTAATDSAGNTRYSNDRGQTTGTSSPTGEGGRNYYDSRGNRTGSTSSRR